MPEPLMPPLDDGLRMTIRYCSECGYAQRAAWLASEMLTGYGQYIAGLELQPGGGGEFEVSIGDSLVHSKRANGQFPEPDGIAEALVAIVDAPAG